MMFDENASWYLDQNIQKYTSDPKGVNKLELNLSDDKGEYSAVGTGFVAANFKASMKGFRYGNMLSRT
jgi:hypothetical protein